jgi:hypothetical protein
LNGPAQALPGFRRGGNDRLVIVEQPQRQEALLQKEPHALDRIELGRIGRQRHQRDVRRHTQCPAAVPARAVEHERDVLVISDRLGESVEKRLHSRAVRVRQNERERVVRAGLDGRVDVGVHIALIEQARRSLAALPPDVAHTPLLPDARLVLEIQAQALIFVRTLNFFQD